MSERKALIRANFRNAVFGRDDYRCRVCGKTSDLDAHHITNRNDMPYGGYVTENGISLCEYCHIKAEDVDQYVRGLRPDGDDLDNSYLNIELYKLIGSSKEIATKACERLKDV